MVLALLRTLLYWAAGLALAHSGMRALTGTAAPASFASDLATFLPAMLALAALPAGVVASRHFLPTNPGRLARLGSVVGVVAALAAGSYLFSDQVAPRLVGAGPTAAEPASLTSSQLRAEAHDAVASAQALDNAGSSSAEAWQTVNRLAFVHELRIVQALLLPILGLVGFLAGFGTRRLESPWRAMTLWGLALFLVFSMFMAGENGYELIVLRSAGPMAFVAWLQAVVPGSVLVGLLATMWPELIMPAELPLDDGVV